MNAVCIISAENGAYVPQIFAEQFSNWRGVNPLHRAALLLGPDGPNYLKAWEIVMREAYYRDDADDLWVLHQDSNGNLFAVLA